MPYILYRARNIKTNRVYINFIYLDFGRTDILNAVVWYHYNIAFERGASDSFHAAIREDKQAFRWRAKEDPLYDSLKSMNAIKYQVIKDIVEEHGQDGVYNYSDLQDIEDTMSHTDSNSEKHIEAMKEVWQRGDRGLNYKRNFRASKGKDDSVYWTDG